jgi:putative DNA primase/helicase
MQILRLKNRYARSGEVLSCTTDQLYQMLSEPEVRAQKDGPLWSPVQLIDPEGARGNANTKAVEMLVIDMDAGFDWQDFAGNWKEYEFFIHSTYSSTPGLPKWRAVFPLSEPIPADQWGAWWEAATEHLAAGLADPSCKDPARIYYLPACPDPSSFFSHYNSGRPISPSEFEPKAKRAAAPKESGPAGSDRPGDVFERTASWEQVLEPHGWTFVRTYRGGQALWRKPGARDSYHAKTGPGPYGDRLFVWSDKAQPFNPHKAYTKFAAFALLEHGGNFEAASKALKAAQPEMPKKEQAKKILQEQVAGVRPLLTELYNARELVGRMNGDFLFCRPFGCWMVWDGRRWERDETASRAAELAKRLASSYRENSKEEPDEAWRSELVKWSKASESDRGIRAMLSLASTERAVQALPAHFDQSPHIINLASGIYDLKTGTHSSHDPAARCTKISPARFNPDAKCPIFKAFMARVLPDKQVRNYVLLALGYSMFGLTKEQIWFYAYGPTARNGKSTLMTVVRSVMGDYAASTSPDIFMSGGPGSASAGLAQLAGIRLVTAPEADSSKRFDEQIVKTLTGEDEITARRLYENPITFRPQCKLWMAGNSLPRVKASDEGFWRRIRVIEFPVHIPASEADPELPDKLESERDGILTLLLSAARRWYQAGLETPEAVIQSVQSYRDDSDSIGRWIQERAEVDSYAESLLKELYADYSQWAESEHERVMSVKAFSEALTQKGFEREHSRNGRRIIGLRLAEHSIRALLDD